MVLVFVHLSRDILCVFKEIYICVLSQHFFPLTPIGAHSKLCSALTVLTGPLASCVLRVLKQLSDSFLWQHSISWLAIGYTIISLSFPLWMDI